MEKACKTFVEKPSAPPSKTLRCRSPSWSPKETSAASLIEAAKDADMLVAGVPGTGGFAGLKLGSVSQECVQHAACPVVVIKHFRDI